MWHHPHQPPPRRCRAEPPPSLTPPRSHTVVTRARPHLLLGRLARGEAVHEVVEVALLGQQLLELLAVGLFLRGDGARAHAAQRLDALLHLLDLVLDLAHLHHARVNARGNAGSERAGNNRVRRRWRWWWKSNACMSGGPRAQSSQHCNLACHQVTRCKIGIYKSPPPARQHAGRRKQASSA